MNGNGDGGERARVPAFGGDKNYDRWKQELKAWKFVTNIGKKKQAMAVALSFPEGSEVRSKIFEEVNIDELMNDDGMNVLLQHLDKWYQKDEMSAAYEAWTRFDTFTKVNEDAMEKYILEFVKRNAVLEKYKVSIPKCILAFKLLDNAGLDIKDKQIVLTAVSFSEPEKMFDSMQQALKKFFGSQEVLSLGAGSGNGKSETPAVVVKTEPVFSTEEVNVVNRGRGRGGFRRSRGRGNIVNRTEKSVQQNSVDSFDRDTKDGRNSLLDTLRHQTKEGKTEKKEIEAVINPVENPVESYDKEEEYHSIVEDTHEDSVRVKSIPKIGQKVKFLSKESDEWQTVTMHSRAGKSTGKYSNWRNVKYEDGSLSAFDWNRDVEKWIPILEENGVQEPSEIVMACENMENQKLDKAKQEEIKSWKNFGVYEEVTNMGQNALSVRWVVTEKENMDGKKKIKARLVARGFEDKEEVQSDSPTVSKEMLRSFVAILASKKWGVNSIDIKAAFLQSERFERDVYLIPPTEADCDSNVLWKLQKCVYGLNDAARKWYLTVKTFMLKMGCTQVKTDPAAFYWYDDGELCGMFLMHVDDFLWGGTKRFENVVIAKIRSQFQVKEQNKDIFKYIGLSIVQNDKGVTIHQNEYCKLLEAVNVGEPVTGEPPVVKEELQGVVWQ
ncbi:hypothetical protein Pmani_025423 [Petrolisthes manimaculis]|uniref:Reverse transcriptase Ty1/copia-type domain-containing protein n=1 Tax=Petrolisthes manimaculis TaxID=1843537 RepID=A0AAE1U168_9EUCA|nr:hypothetical protein Pmani_025423 [Petrolisthes manimaculis]